MHALLKTTSPGPEINVTPLIDLLLVLIIVWLVVLALGRQIIPVQVPARPLLPGFRSTGAIVLQLPDGGGYAINGRAVAEDQLEATLHVIYDARPAKALFVDPGRGAGIRVIGIVPAH